MNNIFTVIVSTLLFMVLFSACQTHEIGQSGNLVPLTVDEDPSLPSIFVNGTQLHSETYGNPAHPMIVVIHGGPGSDYRSLLKCSQLAADSFFVVFYDQRGSGLSKRHEADLFTVQLFIDDLEAVISHYRSSPGQKVFFLGQSWGAMLATAYINAFPDRISGVVLSEPGGFTWNQTKEYIGRTMSLELFDERTNDFLYLDQIITGNDHASLDYRLALHHAADYSKGNKVGNSGPQPFWRPGAVCNLAATKFAEKHSFDFTPNLYKYTKKILFVYSELNQAYGKAHAEVVSSAYPNVQLVRIDGTGHDIPYFAWDVFYPAVKIYFQSMR